MPLRFTLTLYLQPELTAACKGLAKTVALPWRGALALGNRVRTEAVSARRIDNNSGGAFLYINNMYASLVCFDPHLVLTRSLAQSDKIYIQQCFQTNIMFLDINNRPVFIQNTALFIFQNNVSETGLCLRLQVERTQLGPSDRASPYLRTPVPAPGWGIQANKLSARAKTKTLKYKKLYAYEALHQRTIKIEVRLLINQSTKCTGLHINLRYCRITSSLLPKHISSACIYKLDNAVIGILCWTFRTLRSTQCDN
jgi:hypothetical protein